MGGKFYFVVALISIVPIVYACNEAICASVVSKCMLTQSCKCDLKDCSCCKDCFNCLSYLYSECCSCVDMCPKPNDTQTELSKSSYVEELEDNIPGLFSALTIDPDVQKRWVSFTYPVDIDLSAFRPTAEKQLVYHLHCIMLYNGYSQLFFNCRYFETSCKAHSDSETTATKTPPTSFTVTTSHATGSRYFQLKSSNQSVEQESEPVSRDVVTFNCTVAYMSQCMSCDKCRASCRSMGANSFRWFHDGCCECVGDKCLHYGINDSRCLACPSGKGTTDNALEDDLTYDDLDYGEGVDAQSV